MLQESPEVYYLPLLLTVMDGVAADCLQLWHTQPVRYLSLWSCADINVHDPPPYTHSRTAATMSSCFRKCRQLAIKPSVDHCGIRLQWYTRSDSAMFHIWLPVSILCGGGGVNTYSCVVLNTVCTQHYELPCQSSRGPLGPSRRSARLT